MSFKILITAILLLLVSNLLAQDLLQGVMSRGAGFSNKGGGSKDTIGFEHRDDAKDSITISYKFLDSIRPLKFDTSINDFYKYFPVPASLQFLGNTGTAAYPLIFSPYAKAGFDAGFHAYDAYKFKLEETRFYKTTKPFTQLNYQLASGKEQIIRILHTQNPKPNLNFGFEYRLINAPGFFITQNTNHNSYRLFSNYQGLRKRYALFFTLMGNSITGSENGGMQSDTFLTSPNFSKRFAIPVRLGAAPLNPPNPFLTSIYTGNIYKERTFFLRQSYDIGKKDSIIINDSTTEYLFYSKLRFQHTLNYTSSTYKFIDANPDSALYKNWYDTTFLAKDTFIVIDSWKMISNDFSLLQFPDTKNSGQYILAGAKLENIKGTFTTGSKSFYNIVLHGEYRNKTRNKKWDILAKGEFYLNGFNTGDYSAYANLSRFFSKRWGNVSLLFNNVNRSPSFIYDQRSSFNFGNTSSYNKENTIIIKAAADNPFVSLSATNYLITNYIYFTNYYKTAQYGGVINILQLSAAKKIKLSKRWNWYSEVTFQPTDAAAPIRVPLVFTRNRIVYENQLFKNLNLSTGIEFRYYSPYKGYNYSPVMGQFTPQDTFTIRNRPDVTAFMHFRIKTFTGYLRAENINTVSFENGFGFNKNNFAAPHYVYPGFLFRFGIQWNFVN
jgi:hypothetical protein